MKRSHSLLLRTVSLVLVTTFVIQDLGMASSGVLVFRTTKSPVQEALKDPSFLEAPSEFAVLKEAFKGQNDKPLIIHIQDAHSNFSGQ